MIKARSGMWRMFVGVLLGMYVLRGVMLACIIPPFEMWDEYSHLAYIAYLHDTGTIPLVDQTRVPRDLLSGMIQWPQPSWVAQQMPGKGVVGYAEYWQGMRPPRDIRFHGHGPTFYEAQHPPVYYWLMGPIYAASGGSRDLLLTVSILRLVNVGISATGLAVFLAWLGRACRREAHAMIIGLWVCLQPIFLLNAVRVANDALAVTLGIVVVVWALSLGNRRLLLHAAGIGAVLGIAVMTKGTNMVLLPFVAVALLVLVIRKQVSWTQAILAGCIVLGMIAVETQAYFRFNWRHYHMMMPMAEMLENHQHGVTLVDYLRCLRPSMWQFWLSQSFDWFVNRALWQGGWTFLPVHHVFQRTYDIAVVMAALAWPILWLFRRGRWSEAGVFRNGTTVILAIILCLCMWMGMMVHGVESFVAWGQCSTMPWYAALSMPWFFSLLAAGAIAWRHSRIGYGLALFTPGLFVVTELYSSFGRMICYYTQKTMSMGALRRLASLHPAALGTATLFISLVGVLVLLTIAAVMCIRSLQRVRPEQPTV